MDFHELNRLGRVHVSAKVPEGSRQSLPVPAESGGELRIAFFFAPAQILPGVNRLAPPDAIAWLHPETGDLLKLEAATPQTFQQPHKAGELIGEFRLPQGMTAENYLAERARMFDLYPSLVLAWRGKMSPRHEGLRQPAQEFLRLFGRLGEPPLIPYYYALGKPFFDWVREAAKP